MSSNSIKPPRLKEGDLVGICSPSGTIAHKQDAFRQAQSNFERVTGLRTMVAANAFKKHYYSAGAPEERLEDFHSLITNPEIKAIIFSAGGDTAIDLVEAIEYESIKQHPKIISGISDATTLLSAITAKTGLITFLGLEFLDFARQDMTYELHYLKKAWFQGEIGAVHPNPHWRELANTPTTYHGWQTIRDGEATGRLVGGNLQSFMQLLDTKYELPLPDSILFLEAYRLPKKQIHKALVQLQLRGKLDGIRGLVVGYCLDSDDPHIIGNEQPIAETILEVTQAYDFPIMQIGEIGHCVENILQPLGAMAQMNATSLYFDILETVTH